ncbi:hypothetical protein D9M71_717730 [compost metagenome]
MGVADGREHVGLVVGDGRGAPFVAGAQGQPVVPLVLHAQGPAPGIAVAAVEDDAGVGGLAATEGLGDAQQVQLAVELDLELVPVAVAAPLQVDVELPALEGDELDAGGEVVRVGHVE